MAISAGTQIEAFREVRQAWMSGNPFLEYILPEGHFVNYSGIKRMSQFGRELLYQFANGTVPQAFRNQAGKYAVGQSSDQNPCDGNGFRGMPLEIDGDQGTIGVQQQITRNTV
jgi:hypothetical protein